MMMMMTRRTMMTGREGSKLFDPRDVKRQRPERVRRDSERSSRGDTGMRCRESTTCLRHVSPRVHDTSTPRVDRVFVVVDYNDTGPRQHAPHSPPRSERVPRPYVFEMSGAPDETTLRDAHAIASRSHRLREPGSKPSPGSSPHAHLVQFAQVDDARFTFDGASRPRPERLPAQIV